MSIATLIRSMAAAGATPEAIAIAVDAIEAVEAKIAATRALARDRKRRQRAATNDVDDGTVTGQSRDTGGTVTDEPLSLSPNDNNSNPHTHTPEIKTRARKGHRMPAHWQPQPIDGDLAASVGKWPDGAAGRELERFRDWAASATGQVALKNDWQAAWRNWLRKAEDEGRHRNGRLPQRTDSMGRPGADTSGASIFADLEARRAARTI